MYYFKSIKRNLVKDLKDDFKLKTYRDNLFIFQFTDWHLGTETCNLPYIKYLLHEIDKIKAQVIIYITGDLFECADARVGDSPYKQIWSVNKQLREGRKLISGLVRKPNVHLRWAAPGNHESRFKKTHFDPMEEFCETLHVNYAGDTEVEFNKKTSVSTEKAWVANGNFIDKFYVNDKPLKIFGRHGAGSAKRLDLAMGKIQRETIYKDADVFIEGHNHRCFSFPQPIQTSYDEGSMKRRHYGWGGHMLSYPGGYADDTGLDILPEAYIRYQVNDVNGRLQIEKKEFMIDRYRPDLFKI